MKRSKASEIDGGVVKTRYRPPLHKGVLKLTTIIHLKITRAKLIELKQRSNRDSFRQIFNQQHKSFS
ncbi:MAG: hypothetical protein E7378_01780 [Clostridiales bacterium]|nr:hypothetical protein [Clostridiales bacterium]